MGARRGVALLTAGVVAIGAGYAATVVAGAAPVWAPWTLALGAAAASVAMFVLGAATRGTLGRGVAAILALLGALLVAAFGAALALPGTGEPLLLGLPRRLALVFYGVGFVPLIVLPPVFARTMRAAGRDGRDDRGQAVAAAADSGAQDS